MDLVVSSLIVLLTGGWNESTYFISQDSSKSWKKPSFLLIIYARTLEMSTLSPSHSLNNDGLTFSSFYLILCHLPDLCFLFPSLFLHWIWFKTLNLPSMCFRAPISTNLFYSATILYEALTTLFFSTLTSSYDATYSRTFNPSAEGHDVPGNASLQEWLERS